MQIPTLAIAGGVKKESIGAFGTRRAIASRRPTGITRALTVGTANAVETVARRGWIAHDKG